jgi:hypothetical protein
MTSKKICALASCATHAIDKAVCAVVSASALEQYAQLVEFIKNATCFDINRFFALIALLALLCWLSDWLYEIIHFVCHTIPRFFKNLLCGKVSLCLLNCENSHSHHHHSDEDEDEDDEY